MCRLIPANISTSVDVVSGMRQQAEDLKFNSEFPDFVPGLYQRPAAADTRHQDNAALIILPLKPVTSVRSRATGQAGYHL